MSASKNRHRGYRGLEAPGKRVKPASRAAGAEPEPDRRKYPGELGGDRTLVIHTKTSGEIATNDLENARRLAREVDQETSNVGAIVSVMMLREGWDIQNVTVVVGLRPFTARANILPEQAIGRGLRLMFRGQSAAGYQERVDIIGNDKFLEFVDELEKIEEIKFETFDPGAEVAHKDHAASIWCENATTLAGVRWHYRRVNQTDFEKLAPRHLSDLAALFD